MNKQQIKQYMFVIEELTGREIKRKYSRSKLGIVWSVLNPLLTMIVTSMIFSTMFKRSIEYYPIYFLCGNVLWSFFTTGTQTAMTALVDNKPMLIKVKTPMQVFIFSRVYTALVNFGYSMIAFIPILIFFRIKIHLALLFLPVVLALMLLFIIGFALALGVAYVFFGDIKHLYGIVLHLWMYMSALFYPVDRLSGAIALVVNNNPIYLYIAAMRGIIIYGQLPDGFSILKMVLYSVSAYMIGAVIFSKNKNHIFQKL